MADFVDNNEYQYVGSELEIAREATNWKNYFCSLIYPYLGNEVLEVGAGMGGTTKVLCKSHHKRWLCLEPDAQLASIIDDSINQKDLPNCCLVKNGTLIDLESSEKFDSLVYIDVLEHIKDDIHETNLATNYLKPGGNLIILCPAHQWLFTPFDSALGHYRRYNKKTLSLVIPEYLICQKLMYLDSIGTLASLGNRLLLKSSQPTLQQIKFWDRVMVPLSTQIDPLIGYSFGKSILGIWQKTF
ncbi:SAM-dependent methyltransferase [Rippkaea orientalis]|nr:class I SAM-dependent methyltransferase [Rippkaea orientalis]